MDLMVIFTLIEPLIPNPPLLHPFAKAIEIASTQMYAKPSRRIVRLRGLGYKRDSQL